jgi:hypothetical protein
MCTSSGAQPAHAEPLPQGLLLLLFPGQPLLAAPCGHCQQKHCRGAGVHSGIVVREVLLLLVVVVVLR